MLTFVLEPCVTGWTIVPSGDADISIKNTVHQRRHIKINDSVYVYQCADMFKCQNVMGLVGRLHNPSATTAQFMGYA